MIAEFVDKFMGSKESLSAIFAAAHPEDYKDIVSAVIRIINPDDEYGAPSPDRIHSIDDGEYQGTLVYVIGASGYQPDDYWYVKVGYGSCSGCDTLESIREYSSDAPTDEQINDYMTLALHIVQGLKKMGEETA